MKRASGRRRLGAWSALLLAGVALYSGCSWSSSPVHFYVLGTSRETATAPSATREQGPTIGVGPITLPRYLERNNIVTRRGAELEVAEYDRWGEPLSASVPRVMAGDLSILLDTQRIVMFPWPIGSSIDRQVVVDVLRFEGTTGGEVVLEARWRVLGSGRQEVVRRHSVLRESSGDGSYPMIVAAMSRSVEALTREIADAIKSLRVSSAQPPRAATS